MKTAVMLDLETLGTSPGAAILSIGAVEFGPDGLGERFYERIDLGSCLDAGLTVDARTVAWWWRQEPEALLDVTGTAGRSIEEVLASFSRWIDGEDVCVWGNGANFDNVILSAAYDAAGMRRPWKWSRDRCYRTLKALHPDVEIERTGTHHNALDDAVSQAEHAVRMMEVRQ